MCAVVTVISGVCNSVTMLKPVTRKLLMKTEKTMCAVVTVLFGVCNSVRLL
jgi:hypothetical protein